VAPAIIPRPPGHVTLQRAILLLVITVAVVGLLPAGVLMDRGLSLALEDAVRQDLGHAPAVVEERWMALAAARMMHAKELSSLPGLAEAMAAGEWEEAEARVRSAPSYPLESPVLVDSGGSTRLGGDPDPLLLAATRRGEMPVFVVSGDGGLRVVALAPIVAVGPPDGPAGPWLGAAGIEIPLDDAEAVALAGLTRSDVVILGPGGRVVASSLPVERAEVLARQAPPPLAAPSTITVGDSRLMGISGMMAAGPATLLFVRDLDAALGPVPTLRRMAILVGATALLLSLLVGALFAGQLARPVEQLAEAAEGMARGDFGRPLSASPLAEVNRLHSSFFSMRQNLEARLRELNRVNSELKSRQARLGLLQAELVQKDRLASGGRLLASLAHEIRNPVANVRNCLEVLRRRVSGDPEASEFADMAIDELLRMHELAEQMLDLHRPRDGDRGACEPLTFARRVALLAGSGEPREVPVGHDGIWEQPAPGRSEASMFFLVRTEGDPEVKVAIAEQSLAQVLVNLVNNARDAMGGSGVVDIRVERALDFVVLEVMDRGPGIPTEDLPRIFDPFFTTKSEVRGVGLGLFTAEGIVRSHGGRISATNHPEEGGALFRIELPVPGEAA
jgi:two-component system, NtrC family, sensor kinase